MKRICRTRVLFLFTPTNQTYCVDLQCKFLTIHAYDLLHQREYFNPFEYRNKEKKNRITTQNTAQKKAG
ncbi:hypothetical protein D3C87_197590 [compost metagenome]